MVVKCDATNCVHNNATKFNQTGECKLEAVHLRVTYGEDGTEWNYCKHYMGCSRPEEFYEG